MYTGYSNKYLGLDPNLGGSVNSPPPFMAQRGFPIPNYNFTLPQIMAGTATPMPAIQPNNANTSMMRLLNIMVAMKQAEKSEESGDSADIIKLQEFSQLLGSLPMGNNNGMASLFGMMSLMAQLDSLDSDNTSHKSRHSNTKHNLHHAPKKGIKISDLSPEFRAKVDKVAEEVDCDPKDLYAVMYAESGLDSKAVNDKWTKTKDGRWIKPTYATGLIQFTPATAETFDTTVEELYDMTPEKQMDYVEKYIKYWKTKTGMNGQHLSGGDLYSLVFMPGRANRDVLTSGGDSYDANTSLDVNHNGRVTKSDLDTIMDEKKRVLFD